MPLSSFHGRSIIVVGIRPFESSPVSGASAQRIGLRLKTAAFRASVAPSSKTFIHYAAAAMDVSCVREYRATLSHIGRRRHEIIADLIHRHCQDAHRILKYQRAGRFVGSRVRRAGIASRHAAEIVLAASTLHADRLYQNALELTVKLIFIGRESKAEKATSRRHIFISL